MLVHKVTPILNVSNVPASIAWFEKLGWGCNFTWNDGGMIKHAAPRDEHGDAGFAGISAGMAEIFLCHDGQGSRGGPSPRHTSGDDTGGVWMSWWLSSPAEVDATHARAVELGYEIARLPKTEPWGIHEFHLVHPDGHTFRVSAGAGDE